MLRSTIGPYRIVRKLGEGGMGAVYEAVHEAIERRVALKVLHAEFAANKEFARRLFNEARAVNRVEHPGLVDIYDFGHFPDNKAYIVMELLKGETLAARLRHPGQPMPVRAVLWLGRQVADALAAAHAKSVVHRDLKPENVMIIADPYVQYGERTKLLDFGIAKLDTSMDTVPIQTRPNTVIGTPTYMSPEQCRGACLADDKSDVYSFGILLYTMLAGKPPFSAAGLAEIISKHLYEEPPSLASRVPGAPERLTALVHSLLKKDKEQRPAMCHVASELQALLDQHPPEQTEAAQGVSHLPTANLSGNPKLIELLSTLVPSSEPRRESIKPRPRLFLKVGALCALGMVGVFGLPALSGRMAAQPPSPTAIDNVQDQPTPKAPQVLAPTERGEAVHPNRKKVTSDKPAAIRRVKHSARRAPERL